MTPKKTTWYTLQDIAEKNGMSYDNIYRLWKTSSPRLPKPDVVVAELHPYWKSIPKIERLKN